MTETERQAFERDAERMENEEQSNEKAGDSPETPKSVPMYSVGLLHQLLQSSAYDAVITSGRVPYLDIADPSNTHYAERTRLAYRFECEKWDEGMYL